jgi:predicted amidohydrolase YtcJ
MRSRIVCRAAFALAFALGLAGCAPRAEVADAIYVGGPILTMEQETPVAEALAIKDGRILAVGALADLQAQRGPETVAIDLAGRTLMPGFFDSHSHLTMAAAKLAVVSTDPPPAGPAGRIVDIQRVLRERLDTHPPAQEEWLIGWGYDHAMLDERRHPTRDDLDAISQDVPILLFHYSGHQVVVNGAGLAQLGIDAGTPDPRGGRIGRVPGSREPNGILQETAIFPVVFPVLGRLMRGDGPPDEPPDEGALGRLEAALHAYAAQGFTTVADMATSEQSLQVLEAMAERERLFLDVVSAPLSSVFEPQRIASMHSTRYRGGLRVAGVKFVLDGGSPGRSAYLREPYHVQLEGEQGYRGYSHVEEPSALDAEVAAFYDLATPVFIHALGDAAVDMAIGAVRAAEAAHPAPSRRTQLIHVQQVQEDQLDALAKLGVTLTFQAAHNFYFGDFHRERIYGPARTDRLNPARSALDRGISVSLHHDAPVHPIDQMMLLFSAVNRTTRSGRVIGEDQRITPLEALRASTIEAAYQFGEEASKGSLAPGKRADVIILDRNPLDIDPAALRDVKVLETLKDGRSVFRREPD